LVKLVFVCISEIQEHIFRTFTYPSYHIRVIHEPAGCKLLMEYKMLNCKSRISIVFVLAAALSPAVFAQSTVEPSVVAQSAPDVVQQGDERYRIGYQDTLEIQIFRHPELNQRVSVNSNGTINLFRIPQPVTAVCKTERELANEVADAYKKDYLRNPEVNVVATEQRSRAFAVIGAVEKPGTYLISKRIRLLELLSQAGGPNKEAGSRLIVARTGSTSNCKINDQSANDDVTLMDFKVKDVLEAKQNLVMMPGDIVSVLDSDVVYVYGNVIKQGQVRIKEPITLTQAIASSEGLKPATKKDKIRVLRQKANSLEREEFVYSLDDIDKRKVPDPFLEPNDVVAVSEDATKSILRNIGKSLSSGIPSIFYKIPL
jgi:polysaccharide biosynthesis/export protein